MVAALAACSFTVEACAQGAVQQSGAVTPFHPAAFYSNGIVGDGGTPAAPVLNSVGLFNGANCPFGVSSQTGPGTSTSPYAQFSICQTATTTTLNFLGVNGEATPSVFLNIGGVNYPFPGTGSGTVVGPPSSTAGHIACWNSLVGTLLSDCGALGTFASQSYANPPAIGLGVSNVGRFSALTDTGITGVSTNCAYFDAAGLLHGTGSSCGGAGSVSSVFGRTGIVTAQSGDYSIGQITGAGSAASQNIGTSGGVVPLLNTANSWSATNLMVGITAQGTGLNQFLDLSTGAFNNSTIRLGTGPTQSIAFGTGGFGISPQMYNDNNNPNSLELKLGSTNAFVVSNNPNGYFSLHGGTVVEAFGADGGYSSFTAVATSGVGTNVGTYPGFLCDEYSGTNAGVLPVPSGQTTCAISAAMWNGASDPSNAAMIMFATQDQTPTHNGGGLQLLTTPNNSINITVGFGVSQAGNGGVTVGDATVTDVGPGVLTVQKDVITGQHFRSKGSAPALSSCGTSPAITGTDNAGIVTTGGAVTTCKLTFAVAWATAPVCITQTNNNSSPVTYVTTGPSTTSFTVTFSSSYNGGFNYICQGIS